MNVYSTLLGAVVLQCACTDAKRTENIDAPLLDAPIVQPVCMLAMASSVKYQATDIPYVALGNVDSGGESRCGGPPEAVVVTLATEQSMNSAQALRIQLSLPLTLGSRAVQVFQGVSSTAIPATIDITHFEIDGAGPAIRLLAGTLTGNVTGTFQAARCSLLDVTCI
jgi:hypothetical protein